MSVPKSVVLQQPAVLAPKVPQSDQPKPPGKETPGCDHSRGLPLAARPQSLLDAEPLFYSVAQIAARWGLSEDKVSRVFENYRGQSGFLDFGSPENVRKHKRRYSIIRISSTLLHRIEAEHRG